MSRPRIFYVYMCNKTNREDDEVFKVRASSEKEARNKAAQSRGAWRFYINWAKAASETHKDYKWWATDYTKKG